MADQLDGAGKAQRPAASHLFLVRLWEESRDGVAKSGDGAPSDGTGLPEQKEADGAKDALAREWQGKVQHVVSGESYTFQDLTSLLDYLRTMMPQPAPRQLSQGPATTE